MSGCLINNSILGSNVSATHLPNRKVSVRIGPGCTHQEPLGYSVGGDTSKDIENYVDVKLRGYLQHACGKTGD